jgi:ribose transport system substrate-binding protein
MPDVFKVSFLLLIYQEYQERKEYVIMKKRIFVTIALLLVLSLMFVGCAEQPSAPDASPGTESKEPDPASKEPAASEQPKESTGAQAGKKLKIGVSVNSTANVHNQSIFEWTQEIGKERGHEIIATNANGLAAQQATDIENLIQQGCDAIIVQNGDRDGLRNVIKQADDAGIIVISYETSWVDGVDAMFSMNEFQVAAELYMMLAAEMGFKGEVIQVSHNDHPAVRSRRFVQDAILREYQEIVSVNQVTSTFPGTVEVTNKGVESALLANPNVTAIWCTQDLEALGALQACRALGREDIIMIGVDGEEDVYRHLAEGGQQIIATCVGDHWLGCTMAVEACETLAAGGKVNAYIPIPYNIVTAQNVHEFYNK